MNASERAMVIEHILDVSMPNNLALALDTADVIHDVQRLVLVAGVSELISKVTGSDSTGELRCVDESLTTETMTRYAHVSFRKDRWPEDFVITFEAQAGAAGRVILGLATGKRPLDEHLRRDLLGYYGGAASSEHYPWHYYLAPPYDRWTAKVSLLAFRSGIAAKELATRVTDVAAILDEYVAR